MKFVKRLTAVVVAIAVAAPCAVFAANEIYYDVDQTRVTYSVETTENIVSAIASEVAVPANRVYIEQIYGNGSVVADAFRMMDGAPSGEYVLSVVSEDGTTEFGPMSFRHINATQAGTAVAGIAGASSVGAVESLITNNIGELGIEPTYYASNSAALAGYIYNLKTSSMTPQQFWKNYNYARQMTQSHMI